MKSFLYILSREVKVLGVFFVRQAKKYKKLPGRASTSPVEASSADSVHGRGKKQCNRDSRLPEKLGRPVVTVIVKYF